MRWLFPVRISIFSGRLGVGILCSCVTTFWRFSCCSLKLVCFNFCQRHRRYLVMNQVQRHSTCVHMLGGGSLNLQCLLFCTRRRLMHTKMQWVRLLYRSAVVMDWSIFSCNPRILMRGFYILNIVHGKSRTIFWLSFFAYKNSSRERGVFDDYPSDSIFTRA